jgi:23S rRNA (pseudouridine1915-N3)-methyltransferase
MNILILAVGKTKTEFYEPAIAEYQKRLSRYVKLEWHVVAATNKAAESAALLRAIPKGACVILLDERGEQWSTPAFAQKLEDLQNQATKTLVFIIGGAHGVSQELRDRSNAVWSLSNLVFPHEQVRLMLAEQLYRAYDINAGGNYHHM